MIQEMRVCRRMRWAVSWRKGSHLVWPAREKPYDMIRVQQLLISIWLEDKSFRLCSTHNVLHRSFCMFENIISGYKVLHWVSQWLHGSINFLMPQNAHYPINDSFSNMNNHKIAQQCLFIQYFSSITWTKHITVWSLCQGRYCQLTTFYCQFACRLLCFQSVGNPAYVSRPCLCPHTVSP